MAWFNTDGGKQSIPILTHIFIQNDKYVIHPVCVCVCVCVCVVVKTEIQ